MFDDFVTNDLQNFEMQRVRDVDWFSAKSMIRDYSFYFAEENSIYLEELFTLTFASVLYKSIWATNKLINGEKETSGTSKVRKLEICSSTAVTVIRWKSHWASVRLSRKCFNEFLPWRTREVAHSVVSQSPFFSSPSLPPYLPPQFSLARLLRSPSVAIIFFAGYYRGQLFQRSVRKLFPANRDSEEIPLASETFLMFLSLSSVN